MAREIIEGEIWGLKFRKATTTGKRYIAAAQAEEWDVPSVVAFKTAERAERWGFWMRDQYDCVAHGWSPAVVVETKPTTVPKKRPKKSWHRRKLDQLEREIAKLNT